MTDLHGGARAQHASRALVTLLRGETLPQDCAVPHARAIEALCNLPPVKLPFVVAAYRSLGAAQRALAAAAALNSASDKLGPAFSREAAREAARVSPDRSRGGSSSVGESTLQLPLLVGKPTRSSQVQAHAPSP